MSAEYLLQGHEYRHAVEEMLLHMLPEQIPAQVGQLTHDGCISRLFQRNGITYAMAQVWLQGKEFQAIRHEDIPTVDELERKRRQSELIQLSLFDALCAAYGRVPIWGSLTGVRPAKLARRMMSRGMSNAQVAQQLRQRFRVDTTRAALTVRAAAVAQSCLQDLEPKDVSLYIGIPFCPTRCAYCSFISADVTRSAALIAPYVEALCQEIQMTGALVRQYGYRVVSIYMGGGTPTTLSAAQLTQIMTALAQAFDLSALREYTVEAGRPDTITEEKLTAIKACGATRISINPQTMKDTVLEQIGRRHTAQQVLDSFALARKIGFSVINMDVIAGLAGDTVDSFTDTIRILTALAPENITVHTLAIKRGAALDDHSALQGGQVKQMLEKAQKRLTQYGYAPYYFYRQKFSAGGFENIGWCIPKTESLYNVYMMEELQTIISLGAGAVSKRVELQAGRITRFNNPKYPAEYLQAGERIAKARQQLLQPDKGAVTI